MLKELHVRNLALIEEARVEFGPGLNVLTGETGAGKTVLVEALLLLLGGRGDSGLVRAGARRLEVEAAFEIPPDAEVRKKALQEGLEIDGKELILRRVVGEDGKGRCYANGTMCTVAGMARLGEYLVDVHGQHEHQRLLKPGNHLSYLDDYGSGAHLEMLGRYSELWKRWREGCRRLQAACMDEAERLREIDLLSFQVQEIEAVGPREGELEELLKERKRMQNREELFNAVRDAYLAIAGGEDGEGALDLLGEAESAAVKARSLDDDLETWPESIRGAAEDLGDLSRCMRSYLESLDFEPGRLEEVELRLRSLSDLARKYGRDTAGILEHLESSRLRLHELQGLDTAREELQREADEAEASMKEVAAALSSSRKKLAAKLSREVNRELSELNMAGMAFRVEMRESADYGERGRDTVEFTISPGKGHPYRPIARIASGGELSRIMLALKLALARADAVPTLVFDEVDAGIGGGTADVLAEKLQRISRYHQVFSVTHLHQIAAFSDRHISVSKRETPQGITTEIETLEGERRVVELTRMLGGDESTAREHALSMLEKGKKER